MISKLFDTYNRKYFGGQISYSLVLSAQFGPGYTCHGKQQIFINPNLSRAMLHKVLIHEMAHAATSEAHTNKWLKEMKRLYRLGAPVNLSREEEVVFDEEISVELEQEKRGSSFLNPPPCCKKCKSDHRRRIKVVAV